MKVQIDLDDEWVDEVVAAALHHCINSNVHRYIDVPVAEIRRVLEFYTAPPKLEEPEHMDDIHRHQERFDF